MKKRRSYHVFALGAVTLWALAYVLTRLALRCFSPFSLGFLRYATAAIALVPVLVVTRARPPALRDFPLFLLSGGFGFFLYMVAFNLGSVTVPAAESSALVATAPILTALLARVVFQERLTLVQWIAMAVAFCGIVNLTLPAGGMHFSGGLLWILLSVFSMSAYNLVQRKLTGRYSALQSSAYSIAAGALLLSVFAPNAAGELTRAPWEAVAAVLALGILCGAAAYGLWAAALSRAPRTSAASSYLFLIPPLAALFGYVAAGERPTLHTIAGGGVILAGLLLFYMGGKTRPGRFSG